MKKIALLLIVAPMLALTAKDKAEYIADLKSADDGVAITAAQYL